MQNYDLIITGGGASGLVLCNELINSNLHGKILLIEQDPEKLNDRTWCFWSKKELEDDFHSDFFWRNLKINSVSDVRDIDSAEYFYRMIRSGEFYQRMYDRIKKSAQLTILRDSVISIKSNGQKVEIKTTKASYQTTWLFNSLIPFAPIPDNVRTGIKQHFLGQWIETKEEIFEPNKMRLMDFSVQKQGPVQFVYVLPLSSRKALVEYTVFSKDIWNKDRYKKEIQKYLAESYKQNEYRVVEEESGVIPMCPDTFPRITEGRIIHIGSAGGLTKASTGYTFHRIVEDSKAIVKSIAENGRPIPKLYASGRFAFYDRLLLWIIQHKPEQIPGIMLKLFACKPESVFRFLGEKTHLLEEIGLFLRLPWPPFLTALWYEYFKPSSTKSLGSPAQPDNFDLPLSQLANGNQPRV